MPTANQEKGRECEDSWEPVLRMQCQGELEKLKQGADYKCGSIFHEIKSCRSGLTSKQRETKALVEKSGGKYLVHRCPCKE